MSSKTAKSGSEETNNQQIRIPENTVLLTREEFDQLKKSGEVSLFTMLHNLDGYDELLGNSLNLEKLVIDRISAKGIECEDEDIELLKAVNNHTIQVFLHRHNIKMQIASKFNTSVQGANEQQQQQQQQV